MPTVAEQGFPGYEAVLWFAMVAPPGLPREMAARLQRDLQSSLRDPGLIRDLEKLGNEDVGPRTPEQVTELVRSDLQKWSRVIREAKITLES